MTCAHTNVIYIVVVTCIHIIPDELPLYIQYKSDKVAWCTFRPRKYMTFDGITFCSL